MRRLDIEPNARNVAAKLAAPLMWILAVEEAFDQIYALIAKDYSPPRSASLIPASHTA